MPYSLELKTLVMARYRLDRSFHSSDSGYDCPLPVRLVVESTTTSGQVAGALYFVHAGECLGYSDDLFLPRLMVRYEHDHSVMIVRC